MSKYMHPSNMTSLIRLAELHHIKSLFTRPEEAVRRENMNIQEDFERFGCPRIDV